MNPLSLVAANQVNSQIANAQGYATAAWATAQALFGDLTDIAPGDVNPTTIPDAPTAPSLVGMPVVPSLGEVVMDPVVAPTAPTLVEVTIDDVVIPTFDVADPALVFPDAPTLTTPTDPGDAPAVNDIDIPVAPDYDLPSVPTFEDTVLPTMPGLITPNFEGDRLPIPDITSPGALFVHTEEEFTSALQDAVKAKLADDLAAGGTGIGATAEAALWERSRRRLDEELARKRQESSAAYAALGAPFPPGVMIADLRKVGRDHEDSILDLDRDITVEQARLAQQNAQFVIEKAIAEVSLEADHFNNVKARAFEIAKTAVDFAFRDVEAKVSIYNASVARFTASTQLYEAQIRGMLGTLEAYKAQLDGARIEGEIKAQRVALYKAQIEGVQAIISVYTSRLEAARIQSDVIKAKLEAYESKVRAYVARFEGETAKINAYQARLAGEKAKAEVYTSQVAAFESRVRAVGAQAEIAKTKAAIVTEKNASLTDAYKSDVAAFSAKIDAAKAKVDAMVKRESLDVDSYKAQVEAAQSTNDALVRRYGADAQIWETRGRLAIEDTKLFMDNAMRRVEVLSKQFQATAQFLAQMVAGALNAVNASVSLGYSENASQSQSESESTSTSTSTSTSNSETSGYMESNSTTHSYSY